MTNEPTPRIGDPKYLLADTHHLARQVRHAQRGAWFPLLAFAVITFGAVPVYRYSHFAPNHCASGLGMYVCSSYSTTAFWYWPVALVLAYVAISWFYLHQSRRRGVGTRVRPYVAVGLILVLLITGAALWGVNHPIFQADIAGLHLQGPSPVANFLHRLTSAACEIGLGLLLLAWVERRWDLLFFTLGYLTVVLAPIDYARFGTYPMTWRSWPQLFAHGTLLLLGSVAFALAQRSPKRQGQ
jgi:hypothetical protein